MTTLLECFNVYEVFSVPLSDPELVSINFMVSVLSFLYKTEVIGIPKVL